MISLTRLLTDETYYGDSLRYTPAAARQRHGVATGKGPVVVWNATRSCNLRCKHCYANAVRGDNPGELSTAEAKNFIDDLARLKAPVLLISGGEPLLRRDLFELIEYAVDRGIRTVISTNGTLITEEIAVKIKRSGVSYVGISIDGIGEANDRFRGSSGAFERALRGIRHCRSIEQRVGLRFTISKLTYGGLRDVFDLIEREQIPRVCFYHLVYSGRGSEMKDVDVTLAESRAALDLLIAKTLDFQERRLATEILTVDNHADGIYVYLWAQKNQPERADAILTLLRHNGGNRSGTAFANVDWEGNVHPDQFTPEIRLGNIKNRKFSEIWTDQADPVLNQFRDRKRYLTGRCAACEWLDLCNGNFRARAIAAGNIWAPDPACYLTDQEIGLAD